MTDVVAELYDAWGNRACLKEPDSAPEGERAFKVGGHSITVPDDRSQPAKVAYIHSRYGREEQPMPNMSFSDGEMRIPVEDFVDLILRRVPAEELAEGLWRDESVRDRFTYCMANRWAGLEEADRRKLLNQIQVAIYSVVIDRAIDRLNSLETNARCYTSHYRWKAGELGHYKGLHEKYRNALHELREAGVLTDEQVLKRQEYVFTPEKLEEYLKGEVDPVVRESVGPSWRESRDYWREKLVEVFPEPTE